MGVIQILDDDVINKIAAGEVVERPASIVKELVENAIDAGAKHISVDIWAGGKKRIIVADDGGGIGRHDLPLALARHGTSKVRKAEDLFTLHTMGFRGEALASIGAVSRLSLSSKPKGVEGLTIRAGELHAWAGPLRSAHGTTVTVDELFAEVPARLKFLKSDTAEFAAVTELVQHIGITNPGVGFRLTHNEKVHVDWSPVDGEDQSAKVRARLQQVFGEEMGQAVVSIESSNKFGTVQGFVSTPGVEKSTSKFIMTFVNGRWIKDRSLRFAVQRAYDSYLLKGKYPFACVIVTCDPSVVDVNVHPAKTEVRFQYPLEVEGLIVQAIRGALRAGAWAAPKQDAWAPVKTEEWKVDVAPEPRFSAAPVRSQSYAPLGGHMTEPNFFPQTYEAEGVRVQSSVPPIKSCVPLIPAMSDVWNEARYLGTFGKLYMLFEWSDRLLIVDQHAFHERILYERFMNDGMLASVSQKLAVVEATQLSRDEVEQLATIKDELLACGFDVRPAGDETVEIYAVPSLLAHRPIEPMIREFLQVPSADGVEDRARALRHLILATAACHAAVRGGEELTEPDIVELQRQARSVDFYHNCPHGRRVFSWWTRGQLARQFDRPGGGADDADDVLGVGL